MNRNKLKYLFELTTDLIIMGSKSTNRRNLNEMKMMTEFSRLNVIDINLKTKKYSNMIHVSEILFEFILQRKIGSLKTFFGIMIKIIEVIQIILDKRRKYGYKLFFVNFDKFLFDKKKNFVIYDDRNCLTKNYECNFFLTDHFVSDKKSYFKNYSIQPYFYIDKLYKECVYLFTKKKPFN